MRDRTPTKLRSLCRLYLSARFILSAGAGGNARTVIHAAPAGGAVDLVGRNQRTLDFGFQARSTHYISSHD